MQRLCSTNMRYHEIIIENSNKIAVDPFFFLRKYKTHKMIAYYHVKCSRHMQKICIYLKWKKSGQTDNNIIIRK